MLIKLQKEKRIVVKPCDKGAGIIILDYKEYVRACMERLEAKADPGEAYYEEVGNEILEEAKLKITKAIDEAFDNEIISKDEYDAMKSPKDEAPIPGRFYCTCRFTKNMRRGRHHHQGELLAVWAY